MTSSMDLIADDVSWAVSVFEEEWHHVPVTFIEGIDLTQAVDFAITEHRMDAGSVFQIEYNNPDKGLHLEWRGNLNKEDSFQNRVGLLMLNVLARN